MKKRSLSGIVIFMCMAAAVSCQKEQTKELIPEVFIPVEAVFVEKNELYLKEGESEKLVARVFPDNASDKALSWSSSDSSIASVDANGLVTGVRVGETTITAKAGNEQGICVVTVRKDPSEYISFKDQYVKEILISVFDVDTDGEISYEEAAVVTSLEGIFGLFNFEGEWYDCSRVIKSFDEFRFFTGVKDIPDGMFMDWTLESIILPNSITTIGDNAFLRCQNLETVGMSESIKIIGNNAFEDCRKLVSITLPDGLTDIGEYAFAFTGLTSLSIPGSVKAMGLLAFGQCAELADVIISDGVQSIGPGAFAGCRNLISVSIPNSVTSIGDSAFSGCENMAEMVIPDNVTHIGDYAFEQCSSLASIHIPECVDYLGSYAFSNCSGLKTVTIPGSVTVIGEEAFSQCLHLLEVTISEGVKTIGIFAFFGCDLKIIKIMCAVPPKLTPYDEDDPYSFGLLPSPSDCLIFVPSGSVETYKNDEQWKVYASRIHSLEELQ